MIQQRYNVLHNLITILTFGWLNYNNNIMSLVQASVRASVFFFAGLWASRPSVDESSDVQKIIWTIHRWRLFKMLPLESLEDSQFYSNIVTPKYEYDCRTTICDECLVQIWG